jgi:glycosyltransferase involved in cell wall biosynthesis
VNNRLAFISLCAYGYFDTEAAVTGGGAERQIYLLTQELKSDFDIHLIVGDYGQPKQENIDEITLHRSYKPSNTTEIINQGGNLWRLFRAMQATSADVFVFRGAPRKAIVSFWLSKLLSANWVYNFANDNVFSAARSTVEQNLFSIALRNADGIITQTKYQRELLSDRMNVNATVVPNGYTLVNQNFSQTDRSYFLWVGRINKEQKQPHKFLDLADKAPDKEFVIVGPKRDGEYYSSLRKRMKSLENVRYEGAVKPNKIHAYYKHAKALVNTSTCEGFPNTFLEAWRMQTPVLSLNVDPSRYVNRSIPLCYAEGSMDSLLSAVEKIATDETMWRNAIEGPYEYFQRHLTIEQVAQDYAEAIRRAL